jgi:multidrug resistance protein MdtO
MATLAPSIPASPASRSWLWEFLKEELAPYPGRFYLVARMVTAATLVMILCMTFKTPYGAYACVYALILSRESLGDSADAAKTLAIGSMFGGAYAMLAALLVLGDPMLRLMWVIGTLFIIFYLMSALSNYTAAARFGYLVVITIPLWDEHISGELKVEGTLWAVGAITVASAIGLLLELAFKKLRRTDELMESIAERLASVEELLTTYADGRPMDETATASITGLALAGMSRLRRLLNHGAYAPHYGEHMGALVALVGRVVDLAANLAQFSFQIGAEDRERMRNLAERIATIRGDLARGRVPAATEPATERETSSGVPLLREMERTVSLIPEVFTGSESLEAFAPSPSGHSRPKTWFVADALSNSEHVKFGLRGCLAGSLCYIIYNAIDWTGLSTAVTTCLLTALTTVGSSRQKQFLRFAGALVGGVLMGFGAQIFILPHIDSITGFTLLFLAVTIPSAWIITSSPRLSYFGAQIAVAFYLINLEEFKFQTSLGVARDRVAGILLGLFMMWLAFDQLWGASAVVEMKRTFISSLRLLAQLVREPLPGEPRDIIERSYSLRETINSQFDKARAQADAVLFEFGPSRQHDLALRGRILSWQTHLRTLFVARIALWKYRFQLPGFELPEAVHSAQQEFDESVAQDIDDLADQMEGKAAKQRTNIVESLDRLEKTIQASTSQEPERTSTDRLQTLMSLSRTTEKLIDSLDRDPGKHRVG